MNNFRTQNSDFPLPRPPTQKRYLYLFSTRGTKEADKIIPTGSCSPAFECKRYFMLMFGRPVGAAVHPDYRESPPGLSASSPTGRLSSKRRKSQKEGRCLGDPRVIQSRPLCLFRPQILLKIPCRLPGCERLSFLSLWSRSSGP